MLHPTALYLPLLSLVGGIAASPTGKADAVSFRLPVSVSHDSVHNIHISFAEHAPEGHVEVWDIQLDSSHPSKIATTTPKKMGDHRSSKWTSPRQIVIWQKDKCVSSVAVLESIWSSSGTLDVIHILELRDGAFAETENLTASFAGAKVALAVCARSSAG